MRITEAKALRDVGLFHGAYYLAGYTIEFAFKAILCKQFLREVMPDKAFLDSIYKHDLKGLLAASALGDDLKSQSPTRQGFWVTVVEWSEKSRYVLKTQADAENLIKAVDDEGDGILEWLRSKW